MEAREELAAIMEFDAGMTRAEAERLALVASATVATPELMALLDRVAAHYRCFPDELGYMREQARRDPQMAWEALSITARAEGIR